MDNKQKHVLYKDGDEGVPEQICDWNGQVVLAECKLCGKAESELEAAPNCEGGSQDSIETIKYRHKNGTVWFYQSAADTLPAWACDVSKCEASQQEPSVAEKAVRWFNCLSKVATLLEMSEDQPITSAPEVLEAMLAERAQAQQPIKNIADDIWKNKALMTLNADLGLNMDQLVKVANAILQSQAQKEAIGEVQHYAAPANLPAYVNVKWYGKPPKNGAKVYAIPPAPEGDSNGTR